MIYIVDIEAVETKTEFICEEVIETVITKRKRYYIRQSF